MNGFCNQEVTQEVNAILHLKIFSVSAVYSHKNPHRLCSSALVTFRKASVSSSEIL